MNNILSIQNLSKSFFTLDGEIEVLKDLNFSIKEGEKIAIVGPSGCGKSTILNLISGLIKPSKGTIDLKGNVGYMFQKDNLLEWRTIYKNTTIGLEVKGKITNDQKETIIDLLKKYGLYDFKNSYPSELSGGMRQRVALIRTLVLNPKILLLDEPFSALDAQTKITVNEDVYSIVSRENKSVILVTHDISEAIAFCDKVIVMTSRPSSIKSIHNIEFKNLEDKTPLTARKHSLFKDYFDKIWGELDELKN
jgi:NitT/TauT family transport system ATP-binding protein